MRVGITMACTDCKQRNYQTSKNKKNDPNRIEMNKYCKFCQKQTLHRETKQFQILLTGVKRMANQEMTQGSKFDVAKIWRDSQGEFKKITWPTRQELIAYTVVVLITVLVMAMIIGGIDWVINFIIRMVLKK